MIEGGGLGGCMPTRSGPVDVLAPNGVHRPAVADEAAAVAAAKRYLGYFQGALTRARSRRRGAVAAPGAARNRNALYDPRAIIDTVMDHDSVLELRREFGLGVITALARIGGQPVAVAASQPRHLGGALDAPACDKLARFMQLADAFGLPLITLRRHARLHGRARQREDGDGAPRRAALFVTAAALRVPVFSVVLRRGYGLGAMALTAGHFHAPVAIAAWPSGEFGPMGIEGSVRLGFRKELEACRAPRTRGLVPTAGGRGHAPRARR